MYLNQRATQQQSHYLTASSRRASGFSVATAGAMISDLAASTTSSSETKMATESFKHTYENQNNHVVSNRDKQ